jgi:hypothetical protein
MAGFHRGIVHVCHLIRDKVAVVCVEVIPSAINNRTFSGRACPPGAPQYFEDQYGGLGYPFSDEGMRKRSGGFPTAGSDVHAPENGSLREQTSPESGACSGAMQNWINAVTTSNMFVTYYVTNMKHHTLNPIIPLVT